MGEKPVLLKNAEGELGLAPENGGCVTHFRWHGRDVLRLWNGDPSAPATDYAAFPMVPFIGRINQGRFEFEGEQIQLTPNFPPEPHAIHGYGWQNAWRIADAEVDQARLVFEPETGNWPWPYRAEQVFQLTETGLVVSLTITNLSDQNMPAGLGWHPYFPRQHATIEADVSAVWLSGDDMIPAGPEPLTPDTDISHRRAVEALNLDYCFSAGDGGVTLTCGETDRIIRMTASDELRHLVVYVPPGEDYFCVEPVSHAPDAVNSHLPAATTGSRVLTPGETLAAEITLTIEN